MSLELTEKNFQSEVLESDKPVLVDFWATWCGPCKMMGPVVEELAGEMGDSVKIGKVNVDDEEELAQKYGVMSIPCFIVFKNGQAVNQKVGACSKDALKALFA